MAKSNDFDVTVTKTKTIKSANTTEKKSTIKPLETIQPISNEEYYATKYKSMNDYYAKQRDEYADTIKSSGNLQTLNSTQTKAIADANRDMARADKEQTTVINTREEEERQARDEWLRTPPDSEYVAPTVPENIVKVQMNLQTFATNLGKQSKYKKLANNLTTLYKQLREEGDAKQAEKQRAATLTRTIGSAIGTGLTSVAPIIGIGVTAISELIGGAMDKEGADAYNKYNARATRLQQTTENLLDYMESLEQRDEIINNTMGSINSTLGELKLTYGDAFVDQFYNLMLAKSGLTPDSYSMLTGNFRTFNESRYGTVSGENGLFDELTNGSEDLFNNFYAQLTSNDLEGINTALTQALFSSNTTLGEELRKNETDLRTMMEGFFNTQEENIEGARASLESAFASAREDNIGYAEQIGSAEASRASSGFRGGTSTANEALARLSADMGRIASSAQLASIITNYRYAMKQQELNASSTAYNYRVAQKQSAMNAKYSMLLSINSVANTTQQSENEADKLIINAQDAEDNVKNGFAEEEFTEEEMNAVLNGISY